MPLLRAAARTIQAIAVVLILLVGPALASTLQGRVLDPQGGAVASAHVTVEDEGKASKRETRTDAAGHFTLPELAPGAYTVSAEAPGFARRTHKGVTLAVGQTYRLDLNLEVGGVAETVDAVAEGPILVTAGSSTVDGVIGQTAIEHLPLNGRNFLELAFLVPGNVPTPNFDPTKTNSVVVASAGQFGRGGMVTIDGADNNDDMVGGPLQNVPQDSVQEFQIATNRYTAESGRSGASAINVVTRSGTDSVKGTASFFLRDKGLQALPATYDRTQEAPPFDRQQYALALGGPIQKGVAHWFAALEYRDQDGAVLVGERDVATRTIRRTFAAAPLQDWLGTARLDWSPTGSDRLTLRYAFENADDTGASTLDRSIGSATQRQASSNVYHAVLGSWAKTLSGTTLNTLSATYSRFRNDIVPVAPGTPAAHLPLDPGRRQLPRAPGHRPGPDPARGQPGPRARRPQPQVRGRGAASSRPRSTSGSSRPAAWRWSRTSPSSTTTATGAWTTTTCSSRSRCARRFPDRNLVLDDVDNTYFALYAQDDWRVTPELTLNLGLRWEMDTDVKNVSGYPDTNPLVQDFYEGDRKKDGDNFGPRIGLNWADPSGRFSVHGGWGLYYDRITLELTTLERGLDGRALPVEVKAGNVFFLDPATGQFPPFAPSLQNPFTGFILPGAGASGINIIDNAMESPQVQQWNLGAEVRLTRSLFLRADGLYNKGTKFIIGRDVGTVFNPVVGGPDRVVNLESSVGTRYKGLLMSLEKRAGRHRFLASYTLAKAENYANDDQIPFSAGPIDPNDLEREFGPSPNDRRHRFTFAGTFELPAGFRVSPLLTLSTGVPMDILMPDASTRVPTLDRNSGGRRFETAAELNEYLRGLNASGGIDGLLLPLVSDDAEFSDSFRSFDLRVSKVFSVGGHRSLEAIVEVFNLFNITNILGVSTRNYSGYANVLARDSQDPSSPGYLTSSTFGKAVTTAGGVFGSGGPRAFQLGLRFEF